ncbi:MAG TPA: SHOCT domain-containing protein [Rubrobacter sp.]|nr:SHOCT domain-containing protein [Rubrobacter sp.]
MVAQYQGTRNPAEVIVEDEIEQGDDLEVRLQRLASLRDRGLITPEDYETQKRRLLDGV